MTPKCFSLLACGMGCRKASWFTSQPPIARLLLLNVLFCLEYPGQFNDPTIDHCKPQSHTNRRLGLLHSVIRRSFSHLHATYYAAARRAAEGPHSWLLVVSRG